MTTMINTSAGARSPSLSETAISERRRDADDCAANADVAALERALDVRLELRPIPQFWTIELADGEPAELAEVALDFALGGEP